MRSTKDKRLEFVIENVVTNFKKQVSKEKNYAFLKEKSVDEMFRELQHDSSLTFKFISYMMSEVEHLVFDDGYAERIRNVYPK